MGHLCLDDRAAWCDLAPLILVRMETCGAITASATLARKARRIPAHRTQTSRIRREMGKSNAEGVAHGQVSLSPSDS